MHRTINIPAEKIDGLSPREVQCLYWAAKDKSLNETADRLSISPETVRTHRKLLLKKLGCQTIAGALAIAFSQGYFDLSAI